MRKRKNRLKALLLAKRGEGYIDTAVLMIISVVLGGLLLSGLYSLFNGVVLPGLAERIQEMLTTA